MKRTPLRKVSKKYAKELATYRSLKKFILGKRMYCEMPSRTGCPSCLNRATQIHHKFGRGKNLNSVIYWLAVCDSCHKYIEEHKNEARKMGLILYK